MILTYYQRYPHPSGEDVIETTLRCCDEFDALEYYISRQKDGLFLEVPIEVEGSLLEEIKIRWRRIGKFCYCPFCGEAVAIMVKRMELG